MLEERFQELIRCADRILEGAVERRLSLRDHDAVVGQDAQTVAVKVLTEQRLRESYGIRRVQQHEVVMAAGGVLDLRRPVLTADRTPYDVVHRSLRLNDLARFYDTH